MKRAAFASFASFLILSSVSMAQCTVNGKEIPCDMFWSTFGWLFGAAILVCFGFMTFWIWMLIDCANRKFKDKALWLIIIIIGGFVGALIYYFIIKTKKQKPKRKRR
jgi:hypothetical protein